MGGLAVLLATETDVSARLGRPLDDAEAPAVEGLLEEASILVSEYCHRDFDTVPDAVRVVTSRVVARALVARPQVGGVDTSGMSQVALAATGYQFSGTYNPDSSSGGVWLSKADRRNLARYRLGGGVFSVGTA